MRIVNSQTASVVKAAAVQGLTNVGIDETARDLLAGWGKHSPTVRRAIAALSTTRWMWRRHFIKAVEAGTVATGDVPPTVIRSLVTTGGEEEKKRAQKVFGRVNKTTAEKVALIKKKRAIVLAEEPDLAKGRELARAACLVCHTLHGEGAAIGPDLTGVGRSSLDALLTHVIDPNQIIGQGYENVIVETKDGQTLSGRLVEETDTRIRLVNLGPTEFVVAKDQIKSRQVSDLSLMPEGLDALPDEEFRNLIWYILTPPQDGPLSDERRSELIGTDSLGVQIDTPVDGESVALWNPQWEVDAPSFEGTPRKLVRMAERTNVLETHPFDDSRPAALEGQFEVPEAGAVLEIEVASHLQGDWELRASIQGEIVKRTIVNRKGGVWKTVTLDLSGYAGKRINVRLENAANGWEQEFAYWSRVLLQPKRTVTLND